MMCEKLIAVSLVICFKSEFENDQVVQLVSEQLED